MSMELDLLHDYMSDVDAEESELLSARLILDVAIRGEVDRGDHTQTVPPARKLRDSKVSSRVTRWSVRTAAVAAVAAALVLTLLLLPTSKATAPMSAAAAQISRLADAVQSLPVLQAGQWSSYQLDGDLTATVQLESTPPVTTAASIPIDVDEWSNSPGASCTSQQLGTASFASPANAQAWQAMGLVDTPANQPATGCDGDTGPLSSTGATLPSIDGSSITRDPATLVAQLEAGTTGISRIDEAGYKDPPQEAAFIRLTYLLVGPITGGWPGLGQELLRAMALLPGVISLGSSTSHSGQQGLAFTSGPQPGAVIPIVVIDPNSGSLLEARDLDMQVLNSEAEDFVGSSSAAVFNDGVGYGLTAQWIDPVAAPVVVDQSALPTWIDSFHIIDAVTKPTTTNAEVSAIAQPFLAMGDIFAGESDANGLVIGYDITVVGTSADENAVVAALTASGLFESISVKM
jgi:hypothetical protein